MNFIISEMTFLRYFIPLITEGNRRNISSTVYTIGCNKYSCPIKNISSLKELSKKYNFLVKPIQHIKNHHAPTFMIEGVGIDYLSEKHEKIVIPYMIDFISLHKRYIDKADHIVMPSKFIAEFYNIPQEKLLYLGSPKYDVQLDKNEILKKYNLQKDRKRALVVFPRTRDLHKVDLARIYSYLNQAGFEILVKARGKEPVSSRLQGDHYYIDYSWHPHDTLELLHVSDILINFGSTTVKEATLLNTPLIDFNIKPKDVPRGFSFLYDYDFCSVVDPNISYEDFKFNLQKLVSKDFTHSFQNAKENHLFTTGANKRIVDFLYE